MNPFNSDRLIAAFFCATATTAFAVSQPGAHAAPVFPPAHHAPQAIFAPADPEPAPVAHGAWYRPHDVWRDKAAVAVRAGTPVTDDVAVSPWYRNAN